MKWMLWQFGKLFEEEGETREFIGIWKDSKARSAFKEKYWVCGHLVCPTGLIFFLKETSVGCFESFQIIKFSSCVFHLTTSFFAKCRKADICPQKRNPLGKYPWKVAVF